MAGLNIFRPEENPMSKKSKKSPPKAVTHTAAAPTIAQAATELAAPSAAPAPPAERRTRQSRKPSPCTLDMLNALLAESGLERHEKSSAHWGDIKGVRLVVPRAERVTRLYAYSLERPDLPGYRTPAEREEQGIGKVSHIADVETMDQVRAFISAVVAANAPTAEGTEVPVAAREGAAKGRKGPKAGKPAATHQGDVEATQPSLPGAK